MKAKLLLAFGCAACLWSCDDYTTNIGGIVSDYDKISAKSDSLQVMTRTIAIDEAYAEPDKYKGIYSRTSKAYLGTYTDPTFGLFQADFITQLNCPENFRFHKDMIDISETQLVLYYPTFFGDSLAPMNVSVRLLDKEIIDNGEESHIYYTSYNPMDYAADAVIGNKDYTAKDLTVSDSLRHSEGYINNISINLDDLKQVNGKTLSQYILDKYNEDPNDFNDADSFIRNVIKGFYVQATYGDGSVLYIDDIWLMSKLTCKTKGKDGKDSLFYLRNVFPATKEVFMSTRIENDNNKLNELKAETNHTYIKSPAGLCTEVDLFYNEEEFDKFLHLRQDSSKLERINSVDVVFKKYKNSGNEDKGEFKMGIPQNLLLVRKGEIKEFFEKGKIADNKTSFLAQYNEKINGYRFTSLNRLFSAIFKEMEDGVEEDAASPESNQFKFLLVPVTIEKDTQGKIINISHDLEINSARLLGGKTGEKNVMHIIFTDRK